MRACCAFIFLAACSDPVTPPEGVPPLPPVDQPTAYVSPFIGTGGFGFHAAASFPGAVAPNGMAKVGPDTSGPYGTGGFLHYAGYWYGDNAVQGFSHMHTHGTGIADYGILTLMPSDDFDASRTVPSGYQSPFDKASETASPGYYAVTLTRGNIRAELTATTRAAHHRYSFGPGGKAGARYLILDLDHHLEGGTVSDAEVVVSPDQHSLSGHLHSNGGMSRRYGGHDLFFAIRTRQPFSKQLVWSAGVAPADGQRASGTGVGAALAFDAIEGAPTIEVQVGLSLVSIDHAAANLAAEMPDWAFDATHKQTAAAWDALLSAARVEGGTEEQRRIFYTGLYHAFLMPTIQTDADGSFHGHDGMIHQADGYRFMSDLSLWDTYRTLHPLYSLLAPEQARDAVRSLHEMARETGHFPKWPLAGGDGGSMIGANAEIVVADAYLKGVRDFDAQGAYSVLRGAALDAVTPAGGRGGREQVVPYMKMGYVTADDTGTVSLTTEYGREDFALSNLAAALGETDDANTLRAHSLGYRKLFDPGSGFLRGRHADGSFTASHFEPLCSCPDYVEANAWQSLWMPSYDVDGMKTLFGGSGPYLDQLTSFFSQSKDYFDTLDPKALTASLQAPYYWPGNEPDIHAAYLFAQAGRPDLTQQWARWALLTHFSAAADGLPGNDDGGTMSAWAVFSALGIYPLVGSDQYAIGSPLFSRVQLRVPGGVFTIAADGAAAENAYVQSADLDGVPLTRPILIHKDLQAGHTLHMVMGPLPSSWGQTP